MTGHRASVAPPNAPATSPAAMWRARFVTLWHFEVRAQLREPLTVLYVLVFGFLTLGYIATDAVQLVSDRDAVPRTAPWALMLAFGGLTAFGQVITTMIAATAMLRDEAQRTRALLATSGVDGRTWFTARVAAALAVMMLVYAAMPLGILAGVIGTNGDVAGAGVSAVRAYGMVTLPTMLIVTLLLSCAAAITRRVLGVLAVALALVGLWQLSLALVNPTAGGMVRTLGALLDPFGNAPVLHMTAQWTVQERSTVAVPLDGVLLLNRALWCALSLSVTAVVWLRYGTHLLAQGAASGDDDTTHAAVYGRLSRLGSAGASVREFTAAWMQRDGGWRIVSALAAVNALANAATRVLQVDRGSAADSPSAAVLMLVSEHARIFLILLATVYAGELVWRERDVRVQQLVDALAVPRTTLLLGRVCGLLRAQLSIVGPIALGALVVALWRGGEGVAVIEPWIAWSLSVLWLPFTLLTLLSLTVHVLLDHKVGAHLLLITGWVIATAIDTDGWPWLLQFASSAPLLQGGQVPWGLHAQRGAYWSAVGAALLVICWWRWPMRAAARQY